MNRKSPTAEPKSAGKLAELFVLGLVIGACSLAMSFLWKGYAYRASDLFQRVSAEAYGQPLPVPIVLIDIGDVTCRDWAKSRYRGSCALMPRFPHDNLARVFEGLAVSKPALVIVDLDLQSESSSGSSGPNPFAPPFELTNGERAIRQAVLKMSETPFLVAQPLVRQPRNDGNDDYIAVPTILHGIDRANLRFGHVEQVIDADGVIRRFPATLMNINEFGEELPSAIPHLALLVCSVVKDERLCGSARSTSQSGSRESPASFLRFGEKRVNPDDLIQFRYLIPKDLDRLSSRGVRRIEARAIESSMSDLSSLSGSVVILGSTARGRSDYHFTPLNVLGGDTAGVVVVLNEAVASVLSSALEVPSFSIIALEKLVLILLSTVLVFVLFWRPLIDKHTTRTTMADCVSLTVRFCVVMAFIIATNGILLAVIAFYALNQGEVADPITPVVAAILDAVVDVSVVIGLWVGPWADKWWGRLPGTVS